VTRESGILETAQFIFIMMGVAIAVQLLFDPFIRRRPLILAFTAIATVACFYPASILAARRSAGASIFSSGSRPTS
jgi:hypothetical protein